MNNVINNVILLFFLILFCDQVMAKEIFYGSAPETIRLSYGQSTIFRFTKQVRTISQANRYEIKPADDSDPDYSVLTVRPRFTSGASQVVFILSDGTSVNVKLVMAPKGQSPSEAFYDFKSKSELIENEESESKLPVVTEIELMKAMIRDDEVVGYSKQTLSKWINSHFADVSVTLTRIYSGKEYNGYVYSITNERKKSPITVDIQKIVIGTPNLSVLAQIDNEVIGDEKGKMATTNLRIVAKASATYGDAVLPITLSSPVSDSTKKVEVSNAK